MLLTPSLATVKKYGWTIEEWAVQADLQKHACYVCKQEPKKGRLCIDHEHVKGWKKMPPEKRKNFIRGLLCFRCNTTYVGRAITVERSRMVTEYLQNYENKKKELGLT